METSLISVLVIDGDATSRNYLSAMLSKSGYFILSAALGREGLISAWRDQPGIIIFDPALPDLTGIELVNRLRQDRRTSKVKLVALSGQENPQEKAAILAAGCNEYLIKSSQTVEELLELFPRFINAIPNVPKLEGKLIAFVSAKGGTGTSSLCANVAMCLAGEKPDKKIALLDLVLPIGSIARIVGYSGQFNLVKAAMLEPDQMTPAYFIENLPRVSGWYFHLLAGSADPESTRKLQGERVGDILKAILNSYDFVFVDLGRTLSRISLPIIKKADVIAMILNTDLATTDLTSTVLEYLKAQGVDPLRIFLFQNRAVGLEGLTKLELEKRIGLPIRVNMPYMGDNLTVANNRHEPLAAKLENDSTVLLLKQAANEMIELDKHSNR